MGRQVPSTVVLLARLRVDRSAQGSGLVRSLLIDALRRTAQASEIIGVRALSDPCRIQAAQGLLPAYRRLEESPTDPLHLLLLIKDLRGARAVIVGRHSPYGSAGSLRGGLGESIPPIPVAAGTPCLPTVPPVVRPGNPGDSRSLNWAATVLQVRERMAAAACAAAGGRRARQ